MSNTITSETCAADQEWVSSCRSSPFDTEPVFLQPLNVMLQAVTLGSCMAGPAGIPIVGAINIISGSISLIMSPQQKSTADIVFSTLKTFFEQQKMADKMVKMKEFDEYCESQKQHIQTTDPNMKEYLVEFLVDRLKGFIKEFNNSVSEFSEGVTFEDPKNRVVMMSALTCLFVAHCHICRIYASLALFAKKQGLRDQYLLHSTTMAACWTSLKADVDLNTKKVQKILDAMREKRVSYLELRKFWHPVNPNKAAVWDRYNDHYGETFVAPLWWQFGTTDTHIKDAEEDLESMKRFLNCHIDRCFAGTTKVMESWKTIVENGKSYLIPTIPDGKPKVKGSQEINEIHPLLEQASSVSFCYKLSSSEGSSKISEWTDWQVIETTQLDKPIKLPVVVIDDNGFAISTRRTIYHRIKKRDGGEMGMGTDQDPMIVAAERDEYGVKDFVDVYPESV